MSIEKLVRKGREAELRQELVKLEALVDDELVALKMRLLPSYDPWELDADAIERHAAALVEYIRRAKEVKRKLKELEDG